MRRSVSQDRGCRAAGRASLPLRGAARAVRLRSLLAPSWALSRSFGPPLAQATGRGFLRGASVTDSRGGAGGHLVIREQGSRPWHVPPGPSRPGAVLDLHGVSRNRAARDQGRARREAPGQRVHRVTCGTGGAARSGREAERERAAHRESERHETERRSGQDRTEEFEKYLGHNSAPREHKQ